MNALLSLLAGYKSTLIIIGLVCSLLFGAWLWHVSEVSAAVDRRDTYWVELIKNAPVISDTVTIHIYVPRKDTSGTSAAIAKVDSAYRTTIETLLRTVVNKDSMLIALSTPQEGKIQDPSFGKLSLTYVPLDAPAVRFKWFLTERPPKDSSIAIITNNKIVVLPRRSFALSADVGPAGQVCAGFKYMLNDNFTVGSSYQVAGVRSRNTWYDPLRLEISYYIL